MKTQMILVSANMTAVATAILMASAAYAQSQPSNLALQDDQQIQPLDRPVPTMKAVEVKVLPPPPAIVAQTAPPVPVAKKAATPTVAPVTVPAVDSGRLNLNTMVKMMSEPSMRNFDIRSMQGIDLAKINVTSLATDKRSEYYIRTSPSLTGKEVAHVADIKDLNQLPFTGARTADFLGVKYKDQTAWVHKDGAAAMLKNIAAMNAAPKKEVAKASVVEKPAVKVAAPIAKTPAVVASAAPVNVTTTNVTKTVIKQAAAPAQIPAPAVAPAVAKAAAPVAAPAPAASAPVAAAPAPKPIAATPVSPPTPKKPEVKECAATIPEYKKSDRLKTAFKNTEDPFGQWQGTVHAGAELNPSTGAGGSLNWNVTYPVMGMRMNVHAVPMQVCIDPGSKKPYFWVLQKRYDIEEKNGQQSVSMTNEEGSETWIQTKDAKISQ